MQCDRPIRPERFTSTADDRASIVKPEDAAPPPADYARVWKAMPPDGPRDPVVEALAAALDEWRAGGDRRRLRRALVRVLAEIEEPDEP